MFSKINLKVVYTFSSALFIILGTFLAIQYAKGNYRFTKTGIVPESGLLAANSFPPGAEIYVDDKLVSATDDTLYLAPGEYLVKIVKEGYSPWEKTLTIEKELVTQTNALLFPRVPSLNPLTFTGVENVSPSPDGQKILYYTASSSAQAKNGLYTFELANNLLSLQRGSKQISATSNSIDLSKTGFIWSPDSSEILITDGVKSFQLDSNKTNEIATLSNIKVQEKNVLSKWEEEIYLRERQYLAKFPNEIIQIATESATNVYISPDKERILYTATEELVIPESIVPLLPATNTQPESRSIKPGYVYVYDRIEDKNFLIGQEQPENIVTNKKLLSTDLFNKQPLSYDSSPSAFTNLQATASAQTVSNFSTYYTALYANKFQWFPDSKHIIYTTDNQIHIMEYDRTNDTVVYSGPFEDNFVYPWPDSSKLIILASFSPDAPPNLYAIDLE